MLRPIFASSGPEDDRLLRARPQKEKWQWICVPTAEFPAFHYCGCCISACPEILQVQARFPCPSVGKPFYPVLVLLATRRKNKDFADEISCLNGVHEVTMEDVCNWMSSKQDAAMKVVPEWKCYYSWRPVVEVGGGVKWRAGTNEDRILVNIIALTMKCTSIRV